MQGWLEAFKANRAVLVRLVARFVRPHEIEDIVQEAFVRSYVAASKERIQNPAAFMARTARNLALDHLKSAEQRLNLSLEDYGLELASSHNPERECEWQEKFLVFCRAVGELPLSCRRVFILRKVYGLSHQDIARRLGLSESAVNKYVMKGMAAVTQSMVRNGYAVAKPGSAVKIWADEVQTS